MTGSVVVQKRGGPPPAVVATATPTPRPAVAAAASVPEPVRDGTPAPRPRAWANLDRPHALTVGALAGRGLRLTARCVSAGSGRVTLTVSKALARRLRLRSTRLASARARCDGNGRVIVRLRPDRAARRALKRYGRALTVTASVKLGSASDKRKLKVAA
jgi:hypothetical protein